MLKTFISIAAVAVVLLLACFGAYLVNRDTIQRHEVQLKYIEKSSNEQKLTLEKVAANLAAVEKTLAELVGELKHLKNRSYQNEKIISNANGRYVLRNPDGL